MATRMKEVDVVIVGLGWTGGILSKELTEAGLKVVALERGAMRTTANDFAVPNIRDELRYVQRQDLMMDTARDTLTIRNNPSQEALPMRRLGSFLPGDGVGGSGVHWSGHTWRWNDMEFKVRSMYEERYGKNFIPADMTIQDWGITYDELEPYYDRFERTAAVSGKAGNIRGQIQPGGNFFESPRSAEYPLPPLTTILSSELFAEPRARTAIIRSHGRPRMRRAPTPIPTGRNTVLANTAGIAAVLVAKPMPRVAPTSR
jgi:gluconate 2-dehydrogenase alpha chain